MEVWIATGNKGKLEEFKLALEKLSLNNSETFEIHHQGELKTFSPMPENGETFEANARIKAKSLKAIKPNCWIIADDSGLEVHGLNNLPGVHSARYAGPNARDSENVAKLLKMMQIRNVTPRTAQFKCVLVIYDPQGNEHVFDGEMKGRIAEKPNGLMGFGYDPVFVPDNETKSLAELGPGYKIQKSHRAVALNKFIEHIKKIS
jgi:XTP/dITP diphosphohydrolase